MQKAGWKRIHLDVPEDWHRQLVEIAERNANSLAGVCRAYLKAGLDRATGKQG